MIIVKCIEIDGIVSPERALDAKEKIEITSTLCDGVNYIYYQGDEPKIEQEDDTRES